MQKADLYGQISAIHKAQAVIEFDLQGHVLMANQNFLNTMGYSLDEVLGQHHAMFIDPAERESAEYAAFWHKLGQGAYDAGRREGPWTFWKIDGSVNSDLTGTYADGIRTGP